MASEIEFRVYGTPRPWHKTHDGNHFFKHDRLSGWQDMIRVESIQAVEGNHMIWPKEVPLSIETVFYFEPRKKSKYKEYPTNADVDRLHNAVQDALKQFWGDDIQIVKATMEKKFADADNPPGCWVRVTEIRR